MSFFYAESDHLQKTVAETISNLFGVKYYLFVYQQ